MIFIFCAGCSPPPLLGDLPERDLPRWELYRPHPPSFSQVVREQDCLDPFSLVTGAATGLHKQENKNASTNRKTRKLSVMTLRFILYSIVISSCAELKRIETIRTMLTSTS